MDQRININLLLPKIKQLTNEFISLKPNQANEEIMNSFNHINSQLTSFVEFLTKYGVEKQPDIILEPENNEVWKTRRQKQYIEDNGESEILLKLRSLINKLTESKFNTLSEQIFEIKIDSAKTMLSLASLLFDKMVLEKTFRHVYVKLFQGLSRKEVVNEEGKTIVFQRIFLRKCQDEFEKNIEKEPIPENDEETELVTHKYVAGTVEMLGLLFSEKHIPFNILKIKCLDKLLEVSKVNPKRYSLENFCLILKSLTPSNLDQQTKEHYVSSLKELIEPAKKCQGMRMVFLIEDTIELLTKQEKPEVKPHKIITINKSTKKW